MTETIVKFNNLEIKGHEIVTLNVSEDFTQIVIFIPASANMGYRSVQFKNAFVENGENKFEVYDGERLSISTSDVESITANIVYRPGKGVMEQIIVNLSKPLQ